MRKSVPISRRRSECCSYLQKYTTCFDSRADEVYHCPLLLARRNCDTLCGTLRNSGTLYLFDTKGFDSADALEILLGKSGELL